MLFLIKINVKIFCGITNIVCVISTSGRNLTSIECIKVSPAGRSDRLLIKLSIMSVVDLIESTASHGAYMYFPKCTMAK